MTLTPVHEKLSVAGQPDAAEIAALGAGGTTLLINNRPDDEEPDQPGSETERAAAEAAGLAYLHLPVTGPSLSRADVDRFRDAVLAAPGHVVAHCRSGTRSLTLWAIGEVLAGNLARADLVAYGRQRGFDLTGVARWLDANGDRP
jgi:uncharacterized protein (TIGR01244 family)